MKLSSCVQITPTPRFFWPNPITQILSTSSVSPELLQGFARGLALIAHLRNITLLSINMKATLGFLKICEQTNQFNNSGETEEVSFLGLNIALCLSPNLIGSSDADFYKASESGLNSNIK